MADDDDDSEIHFAFERLTQSFSLLGQLVQQNVMSMCYCCHVASYVHSSCNNFLHYSMIFIVHHTNNTVSEYMTYSKPIARRYWPINLTTSLSLLEKVRPSFLCVIFEQSPLKYDPELPLCTAPFAWCIPARSRLLVIGAESDFAVAAVLEAKQLIGSLGLFRGGGVFPPRSDSELDARLAPEDVWFVLQKKTNH